VERVVVKEVRNWRRANWEEMREQLGRVDWKRAMRGKTAGQMWTFLKGKIHGAVRKSVSMKKVRNGGRTAWMNKELMVAIRRKKRLWRAAKEGGSMEDYKEEEKRVKRLIRNAKRDLENKLAERTDGNKKPLYTYVKKKTKSRTTVGPLLDDNKKTLTDDKEMAEELNRFFSSVFTREGSGEVPDVEFPKDAPVMERIWITKNAARKKD